MENAIVNRKRQALRRTQSQKKDTAWRRASGWK
jgi:hypothetical protein